MIMVRLSEAETDEVLMGRLARGEMSALGELYRRHRSLVARAVRRGVPGVPAPDEEDLIDEAFLTVARAASRYEERQRFEAWLYGVALGIARNFRRKSWLRGRLFDRHAREHRPLAAGAGSAAGPLSAIEERETVAAALAGLAKGEREVVELMVIEGFTGPETAEILGIRPKTVKNRMHRARAALVHSLSGAGEAGIGGRKP